MAAAKQASKDKPEGILPFIIALAVAAVAGLGLGFGAAAFLSSPVDKAEAVAARVEEKDQPKEEGDAKPKSGEEEAAEEEDPEEHVNPSELEFASLPPVIVNLAEPREVWIRMESGIAYDKSGELKPEILVAEAAQQIAHYLKTVRLKDFEGPDGMQFLQDDINTMVRAMSEGQIEKVLISGLIVE